MDVLERVSELVKQNPAITVREVARKLGYAEEKSIYYWLHKGHFRGFKEFKRAVLTGVYPERLRRPPGAMPARVRDEEAPYGDAFLPLARGLAPNGTPIWAGLSPLPRRNLGDKAFAVTLASGEYFPVFWAGDHLAVDPDASMAAGDLALAMANGLPVILRIYQVRPTYMYVHPITGRPQEPLPDTVVGRISALWRVL